MKLYRHRHSGYEEVAAKFKQHEERYIVEHDAESSHGLIVGGESLS
jgi:hypothetical protein